MESKNKMTQILRMRTKLGYNNNLYLCLSTPLPNDNM